MAVPSRALVFMALALVTPVFAGCIGAAELDPAAAPALDDTLPSGKMGVVHGLNGAVDLARAATMPIAEGVQLDIGVRATEPTIGVSSDGVVFMTGMTGNLGNTRYWPSVIASHDLGATWEDTGPKLPGDIESPPHTNDPYVWVDPVTDRVFTMDLMALMCSYMSFSDDRGKTWTTNPAACGLPFGGQDHQSITTATPRAMPTVGYPNLLYYCVNRVADSSCATSVNGGLTFGPLVTVFTGAGPGGVCGGLTGHVKADHEGRVYLARSYCGKPVVAVTEDDGLTWTQHTISDDVDVYDHDVEIAADEAGNVYAAWIPTHGLPVYSYSTDHGATWSTPKVASPPAVTATEFAAIAAGADGKIAFAYIGTTIEDGYEGKDTGIGGLAGQALGEPEPPEWEDATWNAYITSITDAATEDPLAVTVTANDPLDPLARGLCGRTRCGGMNDFIDVQIDKWGRAWAAFVDVCTQACVTDPAIKKDEPMGFAGTLVTGPALRGDSAALTSLPDLRAELDDGHSHDDCKAPCAVTAPTRRVTG